jgi:vacuolar-type H+-ATPase subunit H
VTTAVRQRPTGTRRGASSGTALRPALEPVRRALLEDAAADASRLLDDARTAADERVSTARERADQTVEAARRRARTTAEARAAHAVGAARREAHAVLLRAEDEVWAELVERLHRAVRTMPADPRYPALLDRLADLARGQLGDAADVRRDPDGGGVLATAGGRSVDYRLTALADRALDSIADEMAVPWT